MLRVDEPVRVTVVSAEPGYPANSGGRIAVHNLCLGLVERGLRVDLLCLTNDAVPPSSISYQMHEVALFPERAAAQTVSLASVAAQRPFDRTSMWHSPQLRRRFQREIERIRPDVVVFNHTYFTWDPGFPRVTVAQNVETDRLRRECGGRIPLHRRLQTWRERAAVRAGGDWVCFSESDRASFFDLGAPGPVDVAPIGVDITTAPRKKQPRHLKKLVYIGSFDYPPNREAAQIIADQARMIRHAGVEEIVLAGRSASKWLAHIDATGVTVLTDVADAQQVMLDADALLVALINGGGIRVKILEAFALGVPVISTPVGCEGIGAVDGEHLFVTPAGALAEGVRAAADVEARERVADSARTLWAERFTPTAAADAVLGAVHRAYARG